MKNILCVSMCLPYGDVPHAGGKTVNYYLSKFAEKDDVKVTIVCKVRENEGELIKVKCNDKFDIIKVEMPQNNIKKLCAYTTSIWSKVNPFNKYGNTLTSYIYSQYFKQLNMLKKNGYEPDVIILEWTELGLCIEKIAEIFPNTFIAISEHDVKFQSAYRKYNAEDNILKKLYLKIKYLSLKRNELSALSNANLVLTQSNKDMDILKDFGISKNKQLVISPYYMKSNRKWIGVGQNGIAIYGDMSRAENYDSAIWFIENVFCNIKNIDIKLYIIGGRPVDKLLRFNSDRIVVTGFVDDIFEYLNKCFCMVAPLQMGAGIKVKCLEAISFGIPLIANEIAIEGISVENNRDFIYCESPEEFERNVEVLYADMELQKSLSKNALDFANNNLNIESSVVEYWDYLEKELGEKDD